jgi:hypothetical protein
LLGSICGPPIFLGPIGGDRQWRDLGAGSWRLADVKSSGKFIEKAGGKSRQQGVDEYLSISGALTRTDSLAYS